MKLSATILPSLLFPLLCMGFNVASTVRRPIRNSVGLFSSADAVEDDPFESYKPGSKLAWKDTAPGEGEVVEDGDVLTVAYQGYLWKNLKEFGKNEGLTFKLGGGNVMPGFDEGVRGMKEGGKRTLRVPPELAYGEKGAGNGKIPPNSDLEIMVEVKSVARGPIAGNLALLGQNRLLGFTILLAISILAPMLGIGERGFI